MARFELLVDSDAFWARARGDIERARERVLVQAMTFEGDRAGLAVAHAVEASGARDRRVAVDSYSRYVVSDRFVFSPFARRDPAFVEEVRQTGAMFRRLAERGAGVVFTNPVGWFAHRMAARNHKKLLVMDGVAYVGGINFSDHNYAWHDLMLRCEDRAIADYLAGDFDRTYAGRARPSQARFDGAQILSLSGAANERLFAHLLEHIEAARRRIDVLSPYLTFPFCEVLGRAARRGVEVRLFTPQANNKGIVRDYLLWAAQRFGFSVRLYAGMSHLKAMLVDDATLVLGSSNFDFVSYHSQAELVAILTDAQLVAEFRRSVLEPDCARASDAGKADGWRGPAAFCALKVAEAATWLTGVRLRAELGGNGSG